VSARSCTANYANITVAQAVPALAGLPMDKSAQNQRTHSLWALPIGIVLAALITAAVSAVVAESCCRLMSAASERWSDWRAPKHLTKEAPGYFAFANPGGWRVYWIDNERVLFAGHSEDEFNRRFGGQTNDHNYSLRIWNTSTGAVEHVDEAEGGHCYYGGYLTYDVQQRGGLRDVVIRSGPLGHPEQMQYPQSYFSGQAMAKRDEWRHLFNCRTFHRANFGPEAICITPLLEGDGFLDATGGMCAPEVREQIRLLRERGGDEFKFEREFSERNVVYYARLGDAPIALPIKSREIQLSGLLSHYVEWSKQYVLLTKEARDTPWPGSWPNGVPKSVYLLSRDGAVTRVDIPWKSVTKSAFVAASPTKRGLLAVHGAPTTFHIPGPAGLYLVHDGELTMVRRGFISVLSVAPDGCKVTFGEEFHTMPPFGKLFVMDLCD